MFDVISIALGRDLRSRICVVTTTLIIASSLIGVFQPVDNDGYVEPDVVTDALHDAAPGFVVGDAVESSIEGVEVSIPTDASESVTLDTSEVSVAVDLPHSADMSLEVDPESSTVAHVSDAWSIIPFAREDGAIQVLSVLRDPDAPKAFEYGITATGMTALVLTEDGGAVGLDAAGDPVIEVEEPWALDSAGRPVPTSYEVEDGKLIQHVDTSGLTSRDYPVVADPAITVSSYVYKYVVASRVKNWTNKAKQLGICKILSGAGGGRCTISASYTVKSAVDVAFGLSKGAVSANVGVNVSKSVSGSVSWTSDKAPVGSSFKAWATGTRVTYKIQKYKVVKAGGRTISTLVSTSPTLVAFEPVKGFAVGQ